MISKDVDWAESLIAYSERLASQELLKIEKSKHMEEIKKFLEWYIKSSWNDGCRVGVYKSGDKVATTDELIAIYEKQTKKYTVGEVWDSTLSECVLEWSKWSVNIKEKFTAFAERYAELKAEGRIKE